MEAAPKSAPRSDGAGLGDPIADVVGRADYETFAKALADDVVFRSPVSRFRFRGKEITSTLFERLVDQSDLERWQVLDFWRLADGKYLLSLTTTVHGHQLDLMLLTRFNERFQICEVTAYCRPMASIAIFPAFVYPHLVRRFRGPVRGTLLRWIFRPLPRILDFVAARGLGFGKPPEAEFEAKLPTPEQSSPAPGAAPGAAPDGPRSPFRRF
jgi:hypothetical protein